MLYFSSQGCFCKVEQQAFFLRSRRDRHCEWAKPSDSPVPLDYEPRLARQADVSSLFAQLVMVSWRRVGSHGLSWACIGTWTFLGRPWQTEEAKQQYGCILSPRTLPRDPLKCSISSMFWHQERIVLTIIECGWLFMGETGWVLLCFFAMPCHSQSDRWSLINESTTANAQLILDGLYSVVTVTAVVGLQASSCLYMGLLVFWSANQLCVGLMSQ